MAKYSLTTKNNPAMESDSKVVPGITTSDRHLLQSTETVDYNPALIHRPFDLMEELLEKLKLVNYDVDFCRALRYKPLNRFGSCSSLKSAVCHRFLFILMLTCFATTTSIHLLYLCISIIF